MELHIQVRDTEASFLLELLKKFDFVKVKKAESEEVSPVLKNLETSIIQMKEMRAGKLPKPSVNELFENE